MSNSKFISILFITLFLFLSCSIVNKIKEKISTKKEGVNIKETTKDVSSKEDVNYYNKYIEVMNKVQDIGEHIYRNYISDIPDPKVVTRNSLIIPISFQLYAGQLAGVIKEYKRSYFDRGELSKLKGSDDMKNEIESSFKNLLSVLDEYYPVAQKVSDYYSNGEYKNDVSKAKNYDEEMKSAYSKYKTAFHKFSDAIRKYKPKRDIRDPNSISNPDERAATLVLNSYGNILDAGEAFYDKYQDVNYKSDVSDAKNKFDDFEKVFFENKHSVLNGEFTDKTKYLKYNFEDYFISTTEKFLDAGNKFFENCAFIEK